MAKIIVNKSFDYRWPSGSITAFEAGPDTLTTKRECVEYAVAKGYGVDPEASKGKATGGEVTKPDKPFVVGEKGPESFMPNKGGNDAEPVTPK